MFPAVCATKCSFFLLLFFLFCFFVLFFFFFFLSLSCSRSRLSTGRAVPLYPPPPPPISAKVAIKLPRGRETKKQKQKQKAKAKKLSITRVCLNKTRTPCERDLQRHGKEDDGKKAERVPACGQTETETLRQSQRHRTLMLKFYYTLFYIFYENDGLSD